MTPETIRIANRQSALSVVARFTEEERKELEKMRTAIFAQEEYLRRVLDTPRLRFFRYLVETGDLAEADLDALP
jgi:hypothetical protein